MFDLISSAASNSKRPVKSKRPSRLTAKSVNADPASARAYAGLGRGYFRSGKYAEAAASFERGLQLKPDDAEILTWLARCYLQEHRPEEIFELVSRGSSRERPFGKSPSIAGSGV